MGPTSKGGREREREGKGKRDGKGETVIEGGRGRKGNANDFDICFWRRRIFKEL